MSVGRNYSSPERERDAVRKAVKDGEYEGVENLSDLAWNIRLDEDTQPPNREISAAINKAYAIIVPITNEYNNMSVQHLKTFFGIFKNTVDKMESAAPDGYEELVDAYRNFGEIIIDEYIENEFAETLTVAEDAHGLEMSNQEKLGLMQKYLEQAQD